MKAASHSFSKHGGANEDALRTCTHAREPSMFLAFLADGLGGRPGGAHAANIAVETGMALAGAATSAQVGRPEFWTEMLTTIDMEIQRAEVAGYTTLVAMCVAGGAVVGASVGDSDALLIVGLKPPVWLTGAQKKEPALGFGAARPVAFRAILGNSWTLALMSDGVTKFAGKERPLPEILLGQDSENAAQELLNEAKLRGGGQLVDDFSLIILRNE